MDVAILVSLLANWSLLDEPLSYLVILGEQVLNQ